MTDTDDPRAAIRRTGHPLTLPILVHLGYRPVSSPLDDNLTEPSDPDPCLH